MSSGSTATKTRAEKVAAANARTFQTWASISFSERCFTSKNPKINGRNSLSFFIEKMELVDKAEFDYNGKRVPPQTVIKMTASTFFEKDGEFEQLKFNIDLPLKDRSRICNVFLNRLAFAVSEKESNDLAWDGSCRLAVYEKDEKAKLFVSFFEDFEMAEAYQGVSTDFFPYSEQDGYFENVPRPEKLLNKKGEPVMVDGREAYDNTEFDKFYLELASDLCDKVNGFEFGDSE